MKKHTLLAFLVLVLIQVKGQTILTDSLSGSYCAGSNLGVSYLITGTFNAGNVFTAQLSNGAGSFNTPVNIGSLTSITGGIIAVTLPTSVSLGTGYRIRVVSSSPAATGTDNGINLTINPIPSTPSLVASGSACLGSDSLTLSNLGNAYQITWYTGGTGVYTTTPSYQPSTVAGGNGQGSAANQLNGPEGIFADNIGNVYVADVLNDRIQKFPSGSSSSTNGTTIAGGNGQGSGANQFNQPWGVFLDGASNIYVADQQNSRVQKFPSSSTSSTNGVTVASSSQIVHPGSVFVDASGYVYVADAGSNAIKKFPPGSSSSTVGVVVAGGNGQGNALNQLSSPQGVYLDGIGNIYVADEGNDRILKFPSGSTSGTNGSVVAGGNGSGSDSIHFNEPFSVCIDGNNNIYVADALNNRIQKFPPNSSSTTNGLTVAGGNGLGSLPNQLAFPAGVFVDGNGNIYVADYNNYRVQKWSPGAPDSTYTPTAAGTYTAIYVTWAGCTSPSSNPVTINASVSPTVSLAITAGSQTTCVGSPVTFSASATNVGSSPTYNFEINGSSVQSGSNISYTSNSLSNNDTITCILTSNVSCASPNSAVSNNKIMTVNPLPTPVIQRSNNILETGAYSSYQWLRNGNAVSNATSPTLIITQDGTYTVLVTDANGCSNTSMPFDINNLGLSSVIDNQTLSLFPNPNTGFFILQSNNCIGKEYVVYDMIGRTVAEGTVTTDKQTIYLKGITMGSYTLDVQGSKAIRFVIEN